MGDVLIKFDAKQDLAGQCVGGHPLLQQAAEILMTSNLDYRAAFKTAQIQLAMAPQLSGGKDVKEAAAQALGGKSGSIALG